MRASRGVAVAAITAALATGYALGAAHAGPEPLRASGVPDYMRETARATTSADDVPGSVSAADRVFELRTYTAAEGKYDALLARFRDETMRIFEKHGMINVGYWTPQDAPLSDNTLVYMLAHESREAAERSWEAFGADPEWQEVFQASRRDGPLISGLERVYLDPTDFSPLK